LLPCFQQHALMQEITLLYFPRLPILLLNTIFAGHRAPSAPASTPASTRVWFQ
jgi:hypothetical protein